MKYVYSFLQKIDEKSKCYKQSCGWIMMFHDIINETKVLNKDSFGISIQAFKKITSKISRIRSLERLGELKNFFSYITFDDGYVGVFTMAYPYLKENNIPFTVFVVYDFIDRPNYFSQSMLLELSNDPLCTIGSHSLSHSMLRFCSKEQAWDEINSSKKKLEDSIGREIKFFAYPYGSRYACSARDIAFAKAAGYKYAFSTTNRNIVDEDFKNPFFLPRINVNEMNYNKCIERLRYD